MAISRKIGSVHSPCSFFIGARPEESVPKVRRAAMRAHPKVLCSWSERKRTTIPFESKKAPKLHYKPSHNRFNCHLVGKKYVFHR